MTSICRKSWRLRPAAALLIGAAVGTCSCAIGPYGLTAARYTYTATAVVAEIYSLGVIYRPDAWNCAAILGANKSLYIYRRAPGGREKSEWHFAKASLPNETPMYQVSSSVGIEFDGGPHQYRLAIGLVEQAVSRSPEENESEIVRLVYDADHTERTYASVSDNR